MHLIVGAGVMGQRYAELLRNMGALFSYYDPFVFPQHTNSLENRIYELQDASGYLVSSLLICSPPEMHLEHLNSGLKANIPVFIEKPILVPNYDKNLLQGILERNRPITMVSCNWRFCRCIRPLSKYSNFEVYYKSRDKSPIMDLIHFYDLYCETFGDPNDYKFTKWNNSAYELTLNRLKVLLMPNENRKEGVCMYNYEKVHESGFCNMFEEQLNYWLSCVKENRDSVNNVDKALKRTQELLEIIQPE